MTVTPAFLSGIAFKAGESRPLEALIEETHSSEATLQALKANGLARFCENREPLASLCMAAAAETLELTSTRAQDIKAVVLAGSNSDAIVSDDDENNFFAALHELGITHSRVIGVSMLSCSAYADAFTAASMAIASETGPALLIVFGERKKMSRIVAQGNMVFSDGAVSCLIGKETRGFEICASESLTDTGLGMLPRGGSLRHLGDGVRDMYYLSNRLYERSGVRPDGLRAFFGINGGITQLRIMAQAAGLPLHLAYDADIPRFAHVHSCDGLISLRNYSRDNPLRGGDNFLLMSWSPHIVCGSILRYTGND